MERIKHILVILCVTGVNVVLAANELTYEHTATSVSLTPKLDSKAAQIYIKGKETTCGSGAASGSTLSLTTTSAATPYIYAKITIATLTDCDIQAGQEFVVVIAIGTADITTELIEFPITITTLGNSVVPVTVPAAATSNNPSSGTATIADGLAVMQLYALDGDATQAPHFKKTEQPLTSVNLGEKIVIVIKVDKSKVKSLKVADLKVDRQETGDSGKELKLSAATGCGSDEKVGDVGFYVASDKAEKVDTSATHDFYQFGAGSIPVVVFTGVTTNLYFKATLTACATEAHADCDVSCSGRRKRRDASSEGDSTHGDVTTVLKVDLPKGLIEQNKGNSDNVAAQCLNHLTWMSVVGVLAFLLVLTLFVAIYFSSKVLRNNRGEVKCEYPNPAYKA